jgi:dTDP-4-dehydrorhamnose reductase
MTAQGHVRVDPAPVPHAALPALRVLVTGAGGQLARELIRSAPCGGEVIGRTHAELDITSRRAVEAECRALEPELIVNTAGCNAPDRAEADPDAAFAVNADGAANLARIASQGPRLIHVSSGAVFEGEPHQPHLPDDAPLPRSVLSASKSEGEGLVLGIAHQRALVVRTAWLYSAHGRNCFTRVLNGLHGPQPLTLSDQRFFTPTWAGGLARAIWLMAFRPTLYGIHHWTDQGRASWYEFGVAVRQEAEAAGLLRVGDGAPGLQRSVAAGEPIGDSPLDSSHTWQALGTRARHWRESLRAVVSEIPEVSCGHA